MVDKDRGQDGNGDNTRNSNGANRTDGEAVCQTMLPITNSTKRQN
jgi:hypothetical protein